MSERPCSRPSVSRSWRIDEEDTAPARPGGGGDAARGDVLAVVTNDSASAAPACTGAYQIGSTGYVKWGSMTVASVKQYYSPNCKKNRAYIYLWQEFLNYLRLDHPEERSLHLDGRGRVEQRALLMTGAAPARQDAAAARASGERPSRRVR